MTPHPYRPFTTRDGSQACADCHATESNPIHGEPNPFSRSRWEAWLTAMRFRRQGHGRWDHMCAHCVALVELSADGPMLSVIPIEHVSHPDYHAVKTVLTTEPTFDSIAAFLEMAESRE